MQKCILYVGTITYVSEKYECIVCRSKHFSKLQRKRIRSERFCILQGHHCCVMWVFFCGGGCDYAVLGAVSLLLVYIVVLFLNRRRPFPSLLQNKCIVSTVSSNTRAESLSAWCSVTSHVAKEYAIWICQQIGLHCLVIH